jgi:hypothetical protein
VQVSDQAFAEQKRRRRRRRRRRILFVFKKSQLVFDTETLSGMAIGPTYSYKSGPKAAMLADARAPAVLAPAPDAVMLTDARAPAVLAYAPDAVMLADARAPAVLAFAPDAVMLADARAPAVLAYLGAREASSSGSISVGIWFSTFVRPILIQEPEPCSSLLNPPEVLTRNFL